MNRGHCLTPVVAFWFRLFCCGPSWTCGCATGLKNNSVSLGRLSHHSSWFASHVCYFVYQISVIFLTTCEPFAVQTGNSTWHTSWSCPPPDAFGNDLNYIHGIRSGNLIVWISCLDQGEHTRIKFHSLTRLDSVQSER